MTDRGMVKWQPFNAVASGNFMIEDVLKEKNKIKKPILSDDQMEYLQTKMLDAYSNQDVITIKYFRDGRLYLRKGKVTNIDLNRRRLLVNEHFWLFFSQIIDFS